MSSNDRFPWYYWPYQPYKWLVFLPLMLVNSVVFAVLAAIFALVVSPRAGSFMGSCWARITCWLTPVHVFIGVKETLPLKSRMLLWPIFIGYASEKVGHIFIDRSFPRAAMESMEEAKRKLVNGNSVLIFPEGTRSKSQQMRPFKKGAFKLAFELGLDIMRMI